MSNSKKVVDEMLPMITEFLNVLQISNGEEIDFISALEPFSEWVASQEVSKENFGYLLSRLVAFYCCYYVQKCDAKIEIVNKSIQLHLPLGDDTTQSIDPYFFTSLVARKQLTLIQAVEANVT